MERYFWSVKGLIRAGRLLWHPAVQSWPSEAPQDGPLGRV
jgi:hypothetical protein